MIEKKSDRHYFGTHIWFQGYRTKPKTNNYDVKAKGERNPLGIIRWFSRWRTYVFYPCEGTLYEKTCLREIAEFIEVVNKEQKAGLHGEDNNGIPRPKNTD